VFLLGIFETKTGFALNLPCFSFYLGCYQVQNTHAHMHIKYTYEKHLIFCHTEFDETHTL